MADRRTTLKDIARETGFSMMTVSNVLNGNKVQHASPANRELITAAAKRMNYRPNLNAQRLAANKNNIVGLLIDSMAADYVHNVMLELERLSFSVGYRLQIGLLHDSLEAIQQYVNDFHGSGVKNVICLAHAYPQFGHLVPGLLDEFEHVVFIEQPLAETRFPVISTDHYHNYYEAVAQMLRAGYRRIFCPRGDYRDKAFLNAKRGMVDAYRNAAVPFEEHFWWGCPDEGWRSEQEAATCLAALLPLRPDALILGDDEAMHWSIRVLAKQGVQAAEDVGLFSADLGHFGRAATPSFSGFDHNAPLLAKRLMDRLLAEIQATDVGTELELVPANLVWSESCPRPKIIRS